MTHTLVDLTCTFSEIFSSLQGEGIYAGQKHLFVRFGLCSIQCAYCDEIHKPTREISSTELLEEILRIESEAGPHSFLSLTGGEPLMQTPFLRALMPHLKHHGFRIYLETNGIHWKELREVVGNCDCIAMDMKPSSVTGQKNFDQEHECFLNIAKHRETFVKITVSEKIDREEFIHMVQIMERVDERIPLVIQPVTKKDSENEIHLPNYLLDLQRLALAYIQDVRIIPRLHKILKID